MRIFALGDPHLSFDGQGNEYKPMNIFGEIWENHTEKIYNNWKKIITDNDVVLIPGDISWAMKLEEAKYDLGFLGQLPGDKILLKGNHDLWWQGISKVRKVLPEKMWALQNDSIILENNVAICGTRGWISPGEKFFNEQQDGKIFKRELNRLRMSLESVRKEVKEKIVMLHFPPTNGKHEKNEIINILHEFNVKICIYAHLHSESIKGALPMEKWGIKFHLVSADAINFTPELIYRFNT